MAGRQQSMSMEAALDEERRSVLALLEASAQASRPHRGSTGSTGSAGSGSRERMRASSPFTVNPRSPVRSMLDIAEEPAPRHASIAATNGGITQPTPIRSMLDVDYVPAATLPSSRSAQTSPTDPTHKSKSMNASTLHPRSQSDAAVKPADFGAHRAPERSSQGDVTSGYQFSGILPSNPGGPVVQKRNTMAGKLDLRTGKPISSLAAAMRGEDLGPTLHGQKDKGRNPSIASTMGSKSRSPHSRHAVRSSSPSLNMLSNSFALDSGAVVDMNSAYRRLSDANLARSGGSLAGLSTKRRNHRDSDGMVSPHGGRLEKDYTYLEEGALFESSDEENAYSSDEEGRGRKKGDRGNEADMEGDPESKTLGMGRAKGPRQAKSLMAAAEEERKEIAQSQQARSSHKVKSLFEEPEITVTGPAGTTTKNSKPGIHPTTAFDQGGVSGTATPVDSDTEADIGDIRRAQKLAVIMTPIQSRAETQRSIRTLYRGDFAKMQQEAEEDLRRVRKYLVATDLSDEAAHALEWTIGTVLRDGDTLLAIYCVDEETGIVRPDDLSNPTATAAEKQAITAQAVSVAAATDKPSTATMAGAILHMPSPLAGPVRGSFSRSAANSPAGRERNKGEAERYKAVEDITERVAKLLRKTRLQVRIVIEVIHCKSPKHLITEVIDFINPTLVILGSRGRSALKGVILGSFSNYLVTKSSVPVMVARKRLRKHTKYKRPPMRLANNLTGIGAKSLAAAKID